MYKVCQIDLKPCLRPPALPKVALCMAALAGRSVQSGRWCQTPAVRSAYLWAIEEAIPDKLWSGSVS